MENLRADAVVWGILSSDYYSAEGRGESNGEKERYPNNLDMKGVILMKI